MVLLLVVAAAVVAATASRVCVCEWGARPATPAHVVGMAEHTRRPEALAQMGEVCACVRDALLAVEFRGRPCSWGADLVARCCVCGRRA